MNTQSAGPGNHERDGLDVIPTFHWCQVKTANLSSLVRNVPLFTSLEVSPFFALLLSLGPPLERSPAPRFMRRV